jgi:hypothetical protein
MASRRITHDSAAVKAVSQTLTPKLTNAAALQHAAAIRINRSLPLPAFMEIQEYCLNNLGATIAASSAKTIGPHPLTNGYKEVAIAMVEKNMKGFEVRIVGPSAKELCSGKYQHYCIGCFDARDAGRLHDARRALLKRTAKSKPGYPLNQHSRLLRVLQTGQGTSLACSRSAVLCNAKAEFLYLPHSIYDIAPEDLESIMFNSDIRTAFAIILCPAALEAGRLNGQDPEVIWATYRADNREKLIYDDINDGDYLRMAFMDGTAGYTHKMSTLTTWLWASGYRGSNLNFIIERTRVGNQMILRINASPLAVNTHHVRSPKYRRTIIPDAKYMMLMTGLSSAIPDQPYHDLSTELYKKILDHGLSRNGKTFDYPTFAQYCRSNMTSITVGGEQVFGFTRGDVEELSADCILSLFVLVTAERAENRAVIDAHRQALDNLARTGHIRNGFLTNIGHAVSDLFGKTYAALSTVFAKTKDVTRDATIDAARALDAVGKFFGQRPDAINALNRSGIQPTNEFHEYLWKHNDNKRTVPNSWYAPSFCPSYRLRRVLSSDDNNLLFQNDVSRKFIWEVFEAPELAGVTTHHERRLKIRLAPMATELPTPDGTPLAAIIADFSLRSITEYANVIAPAERNAALQAKRAGVLPAEEQRLANLMQENAEYIQSHELKYDGNVTLVSAGPGCGKTHKIVHDCRTGDVILTSSRAAMEEINRKLAQRQVDDIAEGRPPALDVAAFTPHLGMNFAIQTRLKRATVQAETLWVDEAFLQHPGHALCVAAILQARRVVIVGDYRQIGVKDFEIGTGNKVVTQSRWNMLVGVIEEEELLDNYRLPPQIVEALNVRFGYRMVAKSKTAGNFTYNKFNNLSELPAKLARDAKTITFLQAHKAYLKAHGVDANTCHEVQGPTFRNVNFVLMGELCEKFNEDAGYLIVGLSRATDDLHVWVQEADYAVMQLPQSCEGDIDALMDLSRQLTPCTVPALQPMKTSTMLIEDVDIYRPRVNNTDPDFVDQILSDFGRLTISGGEWTNFHVAYPLNNPRPAPTVRLYTNTIDDLPETVTYSRLTRSNLLQYQENGNVAFKLRTWLARNAGSRRLIRKPMARKVASDIFAQMRAIFYQHDIKPLTDDELNEGLVNFWHNIQARSKCAKYAEIVGDLFDLGYVDGFVKKQVKGQWSPTDDDAVQVLGEAVRDYKPAPSVAGKAGQGVAAWSKARNVLMAAWISAIEKRTHALLRPYFVHATDMSDEDLVLHLTGVMQTYGFVMAFKGDDVVLGWIDADGRWIFHETDQSKFDASFSAIHYSLEAERYRAFGMPEHLILSNESHSTKYTITENASLLRIIDVLCGNCSGKPQTLSLNTFISMCIASQMYQWDCSGNVPSVKFSSRRQHATEQLFGVEIKHSSGEVGSFVGFLLVAGTVVPDIFRAAVKTVTRRIYMRGTVDKETAFQLLHEGWQEDELFVAKCVTEQAAALHCRFRSVKTESVREACIMANLKYYYPRCAGLSAFYHRVESLLNFIQSYADNQFTKIFVRLYLQRSEEMQIHYVNNDVEDDHAYQFITDEEVEMLIHELSIEEKNFVEELVYLAAEEEVNNAQLEVETETTVKVNVNTCPFSTETVMYHLPPVYRLDQSVDGERYEPVPIKKGRLQSLGLTRREYNLLQAAHHVLAQDFRTVLAHVRKVTTPAQKEAKKKLDLNSPATVAAYYSDVLGLNFAFELDDNTLCSTAESLDVIDVIVDNRGRLLKPQRIRNTIPTASMTHAPSEKMEPVRPYEPDDQERRLIIGEKININEYFARTVEDIPLGMKLARRCRDLTQIANNFKRSIVLLHDGVWTIRGEDKYERVYLTRVGDDCHLLVPDDSPALVIAIAKPPAAHPPAHCLLLDDGTCQPTAEQRDAPNIVAAQETPTSCFYVAVATAIRRQLRGANFDEFQIRERMLNHASPASSAIIEDPSLMAPYDAVEIACRAFDICIIERRPDAWLWEGNRDDPKIILNWANNHWSAVDVDTLTLDQIDDGCLDAEVQISPSPAVFPEEPSYENLDVLIRENFSRDPEVETAAGYHCPVTDKNYNRLRSVLGFLVPYLKTRDLVVTVAGDYAHGVVQLLAGYDGVRLINDYTGLGRGDKVFRWSHDLFDCKTFLDCDLAILHYKQLSPAAYDQFSAKANTIITFVDLRHELSTHLNDKGTFLIPSAAKLTSSKVYHVNSNVGLDVFTARRRVLSVWAELIPRTVAHYTNARHRQEQFVSDVQRLLYIDKVTLELAEQRCKEWSDAGFRMISVYEPEAPVFIDFARREIVYNDDRVAVEDTHPEIIDDNRAHTIFRYLGRDHRVVRPGEHRKGIDSDWSQNAADEGGPDGVPLPFYRSRLAAASEDRDAAVALIQHCGCEIVGLDGRKDEHGLQTSASNQPPTDSQRTQHTDPDPTDPRTAFENTGNH